MHENFLEWDFKNKAIVELQNLNIPSYMDLVTLFNIFILIIFRIKIY